MYPAEGAAVSTRKTASTAVSVHPLLAERWSPRGFDRAHEIGDEALAALLEAARWAPSAGNSQPWRFLVTRRGEPAHDRLFAALAPGNQAWAGAASALILRYGVGDWNALHQDLYGDVYFPFQVLTILARPGVDFDGGEFVLLEQRPRAQSRAHVLTPAQGAFVIFPTSERPNRGKNGYHRVGMRHGVATITSGRRTALGVIFHDAR